MNLTPSHYLGGCPCGHHCQVGLAVPAVKGAMVTTLSASGEDKIVCKLIASAKTVIVVYPSTGAIEKDVANDGTLSRLGLHVKGVLLLIE